jgi:hypothetical protein
MKITNALKSWAPIVISLLALLAGSGWLKYYLEHKDARRSEWRLVLEGFLLPFEGIIQDNLRVFEELTDDEKLKNLEFAPDLLQQYFSNLPDTDPRKQLWNDRIGRLMKGNKKAVDLIEQYRGKIVTAEFWDACADFVYHANKWEDLWISIMGKTTIVGSGFTQKDLIAPEFPDSLEPALKREIEEVRKLAGEEGA